MYMHNLYSTFKEGETGNRMVTEVFVKVFTYLEKI